MKRLRFCYFAFTAVSFFSALLTGRREFFLLLFMLVFVAAYALALNFWTIFSFTFVQELSHPSGEKGGLSHLRINIHNDKPFPFTLMKILVETASPSEKTALRFNFLPKDSISFEVPLYCAYRGEYAVGMTVIDVADIFGLFNISYDLRALPYYRQRKLKIYPRIISLRVLPVGARDFKLSGGAQARAGNSGDSFYGTRDYRSGDAFRQIHWTASARARKLISKNYDMPSQAAALIAVDNSENGLDGEELLRYADFACECACAIARYCSGKGHAVKLISAGDLDTGLNKRGKNSSMLFALWLIPGDTSAWKSRGLNSFISDIAYMFEGPFNYYPSSASGFSMEKLGFERENGRLGGPVQLTGEKFLSAVADRAALLRGTVMDCYTGEGWQIGAADGDFRFDSLFWRGYRNSAFGMNKPLDMEAKKLFRSLTFEQELVISYHSDSFNTIFAGGMLRDVDFENNSIMEPVYFNMRSELYLHYRIPIRAKLRVKTRAWNTSVPGFEESFLRLEGLAANSVDKDFPLVSERYTRLPDTLPKNVGELASEITAGSETPYRKAKAIERWLGENCEYTLESVTPPKNMDFVEHFLNTREGYCRYADAGE